MSAIQEKLLVDMIPVGKRCMDLIEKGKGMEHMSPEDQSTITVSA